MTTTPCAAPVDETRLSPLHRWHAHLRRGELAYQLDVDGLPVFYPRVTAPADRRGPLRWAVSGGLGTVHATTWIRPKGEPSYNVALIDLDEGFRLMSRVEGLAAEDVTIGLRVKLRPQPGGGEGEDDPYPVFEPVGQTKETQA